MAPDPRQQTGKLLVPLIWDWPCGTVSHSPLPREQSQLQVVRPASG